MTTTTVAPVVQRHWYAIVEYHGTHQSGHGRYVLESPCCCPPCISVDWQAKFRIPFVEHTHFHLTGEPELESPAMVLDHVRAGSFRLVHFGPDRATCEIAPYGHPCGDVAAARLSWSERPDDVLHVCTFHRMSAFNDLVDVGHTPEWVDIP